MPFAASQATTGLASWAGLPTPEHVEPKAATRRQELVVGCFAWVVAATDWARSEQQVLQARLSGTDAVEGFVASSPGQHSSPSLTTATLSSVSTTAVAACYFPTGSVAAGKDYFRTPAVSWDSFKLLAVNWDTFRALAIG